MTKEEFIEKLEINELGHHSDKFEALFRNSIRLYLNPIDESKIKLGQSKIGGRPDLPNSIDWATETETITTIKKKLLFFDKKVTKSINKSLSFIAQINFSEISQFDVQNLLPKKGILYFFYCASQEAWGFDIKDKSKFKVIYYDGEDSLKRIEFPADLDEYSKFKSCVLTPKHEISLPTCFSDQYEFMSESESETFYENILEGDSINKMLGYSDNIQNEMELECELVTNGLYCGDASGYNDPRRIELEPNAKDWRLLLQIDSNEPECGMMWGDVGRLYFWIKEQDLKNKKFDKSWFSLQCS